MEPADEYRTQSMPEFEGNKFQMEFEPLTKWQNETALEDLIEKATMLQQLTESRCALVASTYGWSGNMERIMNTAMRMPRPRTSTGLLFIVKRGIWI